MPCLRASTPSRIVEAPHHRLHEDRSRPAGHACAKGGQEAENGTCHGSPRRSRRESAPYGPQRLSHATLLKPWSCEVGWHRRKVHHIREPCGQRAPMSLKSVESPTRCDWVTPCHASTSRSLSFRHVHRDMSCGLLFGGQPCATIKQ